MNICDISVEGVGQIDTDTPIASAKSQICGYFRDGYAKAAKKAAEEGNQAERAVYDFLRDLSGISESFDTPHNPFSPLWSGPDGRSLLPEDLSESDLKIVRLLSERTKVPALSARLNDILWVREKDFKVGLIAAESYIEVASALCETEDWVFASPLYQRGIYLAGKFGREKELYQQAGASLIAATREAANSESDNYCSALLSLVVKFGLGDPAEFCSMANDVAEKALEDENYRKAETYFQHKAEFLKEMGESKEEATARIQAGEAMVREALRRADSGDCFAATSVLSPAIESLKQAGCNKERIRELRTILNGWQVDSLKDFQSSGTEMDISHLVDEAIKSVSGLEFEEAIKHLAFARPLTDPAQLKQEVLERAKKAPLSSLIDGVIVDGKGRTITHKKGLLALKGDSLEAELEQEAFDHISSLCWPLIVQGSINPARRQILNEHHPTFEDLQGLVLNNPFVPPGHEMIFLRGIHAGFHGDFLVSSHLLAVQIENSIRHVLESRGVDVSNLHSDLTQPVKLLGPLFDLPETKEVFGKPLCFELRCLLIEKRGSSFRNNIAHGFAGTEDCYSPAAVITWWLTLRICLMARYRSVKVDPEDPTQGGNPRRSQDADDSTG